MLSTAPTALRAIRRDDPENKFFETAVKRGGLKQLRGLFLAGERSEPSVVRMYQALLQEHCAPGAQVVDNWWISGVSISHLWPSFESWCGKNSHSKGYHQALPVNPGLAGKPMPGFEVGIIDDEGKEIQRGQMGIIVLALPLAPTGFTTLFNEEERFYKGYMMRFEGKWIDTGDAGMIDGDSYVHVMSSSDDIITVAAHRFSTGFIEQAIASHPTIAECCVVRIPDALKGHIPSVFVTFTTAEHPESAVPDEKLFKEARGSYVSRSEQ